MDFGSLHKAVLCSEFPSLRQNELKPQPAWTSPNQYLHLSVKDHKSKRLEAELQALTDSSSYPWPCSTVVDASIQGLSEDSITGLDGVRCVKYDFPPATCYVCFDSEKNHTTWFVCFYSNGTVLSMKYEPPGTQIAGRYGGTN